MDVNMHETNGMTGGRSGFLQGLWSPSERCTRFSPGRAKRKQLWPKRERPTKAIDKDGLDIQW